MGIAKKAENSLLIPCKQGNLTVRPVPQDCDHHQEVAANRPGFPAPTIPRLFSALARKLGVCRDCSAGPSPLARSRSRAPAAKETKISQRLRARVKRTFRRRSPPSLETGPKAMLSRR